ncbi:uncharacterized protein LOC130612560 [Hydractinia symbiolongicarpus]|uniref:uncharacterized protein LOC130612560 n=1 Tax=Hydractinia symbiolongicarpus TaxID=13093 RepID=UPI00254F65A2|nr:uncharacterized protein LOC130612560 [Hydractinia symbiolongicarpus]XP_057289875.1 uncharacterized protein LOC130612560 [Hydractinia symbiolongicarpus]XP_057289876.1 uncharacterized protein LOC130612560 [Hydractinia symbiolongicarpus]
MSKPTATQKGKSINNSNNNINNNNNNKMSDTYTCGPNTALFSKWVGNNYGGNTRTKTISKEKYTKICNLIRGDDTNCNAKFRTWVRNKGFQLLRHDTTTNEIMEDLNGDLYVSLHAKQESTSMGECSIETFLRTNLPAISFYRKVAVVEEFYGIIKSAHVDEKGQHSGQKKTYRLVSDTYAFLPREVITYYLLNCEACKPRIQKYGPVPSKTRRKNEPIDGNIHRIHSSPENQPSSFFPYHKTRSDIEKTGEVYYPLSHTTCAKKGVNATSSYSVYYQPNIYQHSNYIPSDYSIPIDNNYTPKLYNRYKSKHQAEGYFYPHEKRLGLTPDTIYSSSHTFSGHYSYPYNNSSRKIMQQLYINIPLEQSQHHYESHRQHKAKDITQHRADSHTREEKDPYRHATSPSYETKWQEFTQSNAFSRAVNRESLNSTGYETNDSLSSDSQSPSVKMSCSKSWSSTELKNNSSSQENYTKQRRDTYTSDQPGSQTKFYKYESSSEPVFQLFSPARDVKRSGIKRQGKEEVIAHTASPPFEQNNPEKSLSLLNYQTLSNWHRNVFHKVTSSLSNLTDISNDNDILKIPSKRSIAIALQHLNGCEED